MPMCSRSTAGMMPTAAPPKTLHARVTQPILRRRSFARSDAIPPAMRSRTSVSGSASWPSSDGTIARIASATSVEHADADQHRLGVRRSGRGAGR